MNEVEPILVIFEDRKEKEQVLNVMVSSIHWKFASQFWFFTFQGENQNLAGIKFHKNEEEDNLKKCGKF